MKKLAGIVENFANKRVVVIGDLIADQFVYGAISRASREAPVFILRHEHTETTPGGAGNCAANLAALGAQVILISLVGNDEPGRCLLDKLRGAGVNCDGVLRSTNRKTTTKVRVLAGQAHSPRQQVIRIDYDSEPELSAQLSDGLRGSFLNATANADAVIISDYNYGVADPRFCEVAKSLDVPIIVDSRFRLSSFVGFTSATPNEDEVTELLHEEPANQDALAAAAERLRAQLGYGALLVTCGSHGMILLEDNAEPLHIDAVGPHEPVDVTGAGDTVIAVYTLAVAAGASFADAARLANFAGGIVVMKRGTATVNTSELLTAIAQPTSE